MLARDWYYNERRRIGLDSAVASIYDRHDDSDIRARAALTMLGVQRGWRVADIGCGNGVLACEAALMGAEVDAIDISPAMLALAEIQARDRKVAIRTQSAGLLSFAYQPNSYDLDRQRVRAASSAGFLEGGGAVADLWRAEAGRAASTCAISCSSACPTGPSATSRRGRISTSRTTILRATASITHMRDEYSTFGWVIERMLTDVGFTLVSADYHAPLHGTYLLRKPKPGEQG